MKLGIVIYTASAEAVYNALRLGNFALKQGDAVDVFLLGEGVELEGLADARFDVQRQAGALVAAGGAIRSCGTCLQLRGSEGTELCPASTMKDLYDLVRQADRVVTF